MYKLNVDINLKRKEERICVQTNNLNDKKHFFLFFISLTFFILLLKNNAE